MVKAQTTRLSMLSSKKFWQQQSLRQKLMLVWHFLVLVVLESASHAFDDSFWEKRDRLLEELNRCKIKTRQLKSRYSRKRPRQRLCVYVS